MHHVFVLMSSNEQPKHQLHACLDLLKKYCVVQAVSSVYETPPVGSMYQGNFLDVVVKVVTPMEPDTFHGQVLREIERQLGRTRPAVPDSKGIICIPIDLDILLWDDGSFDFGDKPRHVPDPAILQQPHLAYPLAEIAPDYVHPEDGRILAQIAQELPSHTLQLRYDLQLF